MWRAMMSVRLMCPSPRLSCAYSRIVRVRVDLPSVTCAGGGAATETNVRLSSAADSSDVSGIRTVWQKLREPACRLTCAIQRNRYVAPWIVGPFQILDEPLRQRFGAQVGRIENID